MPCCTFDRTLDTMMKSFSRPCKLREEEKVGQEVEVK